MRDSTKLIFIGLCILASCFGCTLEGQGPLGIPIAGKGYDGPVEVLDRQDDAVLIVWKWTYGEAATVAYPPPIVWLRDATCTDPQSGEVYQNSFKCGGGNDDSCCDGYYNVQSDVINLALGEGESISDTGFAHELCHAWLQRSGMDPDGNHAGPCFLGVAAGDDVEGSKVFEARRRLRVVGL